MSKTKLRDSNIELYRIIVISFLFFKNIKMGYSSIINKISATCFGVLLIHSNSETMRRWLWNDVLNNVGMYNSDMLAFHAVFSVLGVFVICSVIDMARIKLIETPVFNYFDNLNNKFPLWFKRIKILIDTLGVEND